MEQYIRKLCGITALRVVHAVPDSDRFPGAFGVVVDGSRCVRVGSWRSYVRPEKAWFDQHRPDAEGRDFEGQGFCMQELSAEVLEEALKLHGIQVLNVAGASESRTPGIQGYVRETLRVLWQRGLT